MAEARLRFGPFALDPGAGDLLRDGVPVALGQRALGVLAVLVEAGGAAVSKDVLMERAWPGVTVEEGNLTVQISALRKALGRAPGGGEWIVTLPKQGYRLVMEAAAGRPEGPPRVAVLPLRALGSETEDAFLADGVAEDLTMALGRFRAIAVVARGAAFAQRGREEDAVGIAQEIAADYLLAGSMRRAGDRVRIVVRLIGGADGAVIWGATFDGGTAEVFGLQDRITEAVAMQIAPEIEAAEIARSRRERPASMAAHDLYLRALPHLYAETMEANDRAIALLDQAIALDPENPDYLSRASWAREHRITVGWPPHGADDRARCLADAEAGLARARGDARTMTHCALSLLLVGGMADRAVEVLQRAVALNPHDPLAHLGAAVAQLHVGSLQAAVGLGARVVALSPGDPMLHIAWSAIAHARLAMGDAAGAASDAQRSLAINASFDPAHWVLIAACVGLGRRAEAAEAMTRLRALSPMATIAGIRAAQPSYDSARIAPILEGLRQAGLPEA